MTLRQGDLFDLIEKPPAPLVFEWVAPPVDQRLLSALEREGRSPFGSDDFDPVAAQGVADETMHELLHALASLSNLDQMMKRGPVGAGTPKAWRSLVEAEPGLRRRFNRAYYDTLGAVEGLWGSAGRDAFDQEARRRLAIMEAG